MVIILLVGVGLAVLIIKLAPEAKTEEPKRIVPAVLAMLVEPEAVALKIPTQGMVSALQDSRIASEVAGRIVKMDPRLDVGGIFKEGEVFLEIEDADYRAALANAKAGAAEARLALATEDGRAKLAERDWKKLGREGETATALVLRVPQLEAAQAKLAAAEEGVNKAQRDLDRCLVKAPFDCRVVEKMIGLGSFVAMGMPLADIESLGMFEVRLPLSLEDFAFVDVSGELPLVKFWTEFAGETREWSGKVVRTEGGVDRASRSVYLVAQVAASGRFLQSGLFVKAAVDGVTLENVFRLPRQAMHEGDRVLIIDAESKVHFRQVKVRRSEPDHVLVSEGLKAGERICLTPIAGVVDDMEVGVIDPDAKVKPEEVELANPANT